MAIDESPRSREHASGCLNYSVKLGSIPADIWALQEWALLPILRLVPPKLGKRHRVERGTECRSDWGGPHKLPPPRQGKGPADWCLGLDHRSTQSQRGVLA